MRSIPPAVRFLVLHGLIGFGPAALFVAALLWADPGGVGSIILRIGGMPVVALLWFFCGLTFGSVQIGAAVMLQTQDEEDGGKGSRQSWLSALRLPPKRRAHPGKGSAVTAA